MTFVYGMFIKLHSSDIIIWSVAIYNVGLLILYIPVVTVNTTCLININLHFDHRVYLWISFDSQNK
jgi:hypothetical protein